MKVYGIAADNYKVDRFNEELTKAGFTDFEVFPFTPDTSLIRLTIEDSRLKEIETLCRKLQQKFKQSN